MNIKYYTCDTAVRKFHKTGGTINSVRPMDPRPRDSDAFYRQFMEYGGDIDDISATQISESDSKHLFFIHIGFLDAIQNITHPYVEEVIHKCYNKGITVVIDATWERVTENCVPAPDAPNHEVSYFVKGRRNQNEEAIDRVQHLIHEDYFKVVVGQDLRYVDLPYKYKRFFVYHNMFAGMVYAFHKPINKNILYPHTETNHTEKRYNFSCMIGKPLRSHRLNFLTDIFYRNLVDDKFLLTGIPIIHKKEFDFNDCVMSRTRTGGGGKKITCDVGGIKIEVTDTQHAESVLGNIMAEMIERNIDFDQEEFILSWLKTDKYLREKLNLDEWKPHLTQYLNDNIEHIISKMRFVNGYTEDVLLSTTGHLSDIRINGNSPIDDRLGIYYSNIKGKYCNHGTKSTWWRNNFKWDQVIPTGMYESHISISLETYMTGTFYTEKIWKPIFAGIPVINVCTPNFIESFEHMGFRPYYNIFDYSYDKHENYFDRVSGVVDNIERLSKEKNLESLINKDIDAIQHNQKQLIKIVNDTTWLQKLCEPFEDETIDIPQNHVII